MSFAIAKLRQSASALLVVLAALLVAAPSLTFAQGNAQSEVGGESRDFRTRGSGRWVDLTTWQVYRSGTWVNSDVSVGIPNAATNAFIETNHTIIATRANVANTISYNGSQAWAFLEINDLHINTAASVTTTWGSVPGRIVAGVDKYDGDRFGGRISQRPSIFQGSGLNIIGDQDIYLANNSTLINSGALNIAPVRAIDLEPAGGNVPQPRNMELRVYGKLRYYAGAASDLTDRDANIQVTAATIGTGSTIVFRGRTRTITQAQEWSTTLATQTGYFDNTAFNGNGAGADLSGAGITFPGVGAAVNADRINNFRGLMGRNSFWTAIFDLGRVVDRNFTTDLFTGPGDDPSTAVGTLEGSFTAGIIQIRRGTVNFRGEALLANEGAVTSGSIQIMNNAILRMSGNGNIGRTAVPLVSFANRFGSTQPAAWGFTDLAIAAASGRAIPMTPVGQEYAVTSRMRYFVVEEGGALDFAGVVGTLSAADVRFNGTVIYSRTADQNLVENSPFLSFNPNGPVLNTTTLAAAAGGVQVHGGENGLYDPFNNNYHSGNATVAAAIQPGDPSPGTLGQYGTTPAGLGIGTAALWQPSTTAAYAHLVFRGSGTKFLPVTTVTISRGLIFQGLARTGVRTATYPSGVNVLNGANIATGVPYYMQQAFGGELSDGATRTQNWSKAGYFPALAYLRGTGLTGLRQENNIGTTLRGSLNPATGAETIGSTFDDVNSTTIAQPMWSVYGGNTDPVAFVGYTTASTRPFFTTGGAFTTLWTADMYRMYPEGDSYPMAMVLSASINREQLDMSPWNKPAVVHGLPAEPSYFQVGGAQAQYGYGARAVWYTGSYVTQTVGSQFDGVIRQTLDRVNGTGGANGTLQAPVTTGLNAAGTGINAGNFTPGFPVITNSLYDYTINTTATTTLEYDTEASDIMSQVEFPAGAVGPHNLVMNGASNTIQVLPIRTADYRLATDIGVQYPSITGDLDFRNKTATLYGATGGTIILGPEYVNSTNGNLQRNAIDPRTGLYQGSAIYNQSQVGMGITPGVGGSAYIDTRPDVANPRTLLANDMYTAGSGLRPTNTLTGTFDGRVRAGFPQFRVTGPSFTGAVNTSYPTTAVNDFGRRGDFNNFGLVELRRGTLRIPSTNIPASISEPATGTTATFNYTFVLSSTAIASLDQANVTYGTAVQGFSTPVGVNNANAQVLLSEASGADAYPGFTNWSPVGLRNAAANPGITAPAVVRGPAGPANLAGILVGGDLANILFTGGTGGTISGAALATARAGSGNYLAGSSAYPVAYGATDNVNSGNTELSQNLGVIGIQSIAPAFVAISPFTVAANPQAGSTNRYNAGPEMTNDADQNLVTVSYVDGFSARVGTATVPFSGNNQVYPSNTANAPASTVFSSAYNAGIVRANNAWNVDLPRVTGGLQHLTWLRATTNVLTLVGNTANGTTPGTPDASGVTATNPESAGLQIYGTIATARGDIDLNGRNIELGGNRSTLVETFERTPYVGSPSATAGALPDSAFGNPLWTPVQVSSPRLFNGTNGFVNGGNNGGGRVGDQTPVYPSRPSSVINNNRSVRAYIGLTSHRNVAAMNQGLGIDQVNEEPAGLGAHIYQTGNPAQFRVRRWQTRGVGLHGALTTRPNVRTADRYWQIETTGTLNIPMGRSELRLQYIDTDLLNENGTVAGLAPASLNIFRAQGGLQYQNPNSAFLGPFQALAAQLLVGPNSYNFVKQLTLIGATQTVNGNVVLNTGNFAEGAVASGLSPDRTNPEPNRGFNIWAIGIPAPVCLVIRGQRFGGSYGDPIGAGSGFSTGLGGDIPRFPNNFGSTQFGGGIAPATANNYGPIVGPFKAGVPTVATIIGELLDEFGNVATTNFSTGASLVIGNLDPTQPVPSIAVGASAASEGITGEAAAGNAYGVVAGNSGLTTNAASGAPVGGRFEWAGVRLEGIASTTVTLSLRNDFVGGPYGSLDNAIVAARGGTRANPIPNTEGGITFCNGGPAVQVSLQGGFPYGVTFATQNAQNIQYATPGRVGAITLGALGVCSATGGFDGSLTDIVVGQPVVFPFSDPGYANIAVLVRDRFDNYASFPTQATIQLGGPTIDNVRTPVVGNVATSVVTWGLGKFGREVNGTPSNAVPGIARTVADLATSIGVPTSLPPFSSTGLINQAANNNASRVSPAVLPTGAGYPPTNNPQIFNNVATFPNFQVWGATAANVTLTVGVLNGDPYVPGNTPGVAGIAVGGSSPRSTSALVCIRPGAAVGIAPVLIPDIYNMNVPNRMPSRMYIGRSNEGDPRTWFYVQAVDEFGNRVDNGQNTVTGNVANITFYTNAQGLPRSQGALAAAQFPTLGYFQFTPSNDPYVKLNNAPYAATGTTSRSAVNGLYTFNQFNPTGPQSIDPMGNDVVLTFEDTNLPGIKAPRSTGVARPLFQPIPPVTTATTTFLPVPRVSLVIPNAGEDGAPANGAQRISTNSLLLRERRHTMAAADNGFQTGSVRIERPNTAVSNDIAVGYTLTYVNVNPDQRNAPTSTAGIPGARAVALNNEGPAPALSLPAPINATPVPVFTPALPAATPVLINGLQGDLSPIIPAGARPQQTVSVTQVPGTFFLDAGTAAQRVNFTARWSDQAWPRTPGYQGLRAAIIALRRPDAQNATIYDLADGRDSAFVMLLDPAPAPPVLINAIQDKILPRPRTNVATEDRIELESPKWREDGIPGFVFYDDNYDPMTYSATSEDATQVTATIVNSDPRFQGRPSLFYAVQPNADTNRAAGVRITVRAFDGTTVTPDEARFAVDDFIVYVRSSVTSVANASEIGLTVSPNPAVERIAVQATAKQSGAIRIVMTNALGQEVLASSQNVVAGTAFRQEFNLEGLANGTYFVQVIEGGRTFTQKVTKF